MEVQHCLLGLSLLFLASCHYGEMEESINLENDECRTKHTADLCIKNDFHTEIDVYIDDHWQLSVKNGHKKCLTVSAGLHNMRFEEKSISHFRRTWHRDAFEIHECSSHEMVIAN